MFLKGLAFYIEKTEAGVETSRGEDALQMP